MSMSVDTRVSVERVKELEQEVENLVSEIKRLKKCKKYGLVWEDHVEELDKRDVIPLLAKDESLSLPEIADKPMNYLIEGDNYHALRALQHTHRGRIDVIYIDPPYNTGNRDFVYNDKYVDSEDNFRHSKWLSFMNKRLRLARELMSDNGVIFISIDDNEQAQLKLLCDEIFGEDNFVSNVVVKMSELKGFKMKNADKKFPKIKEFLYVYSKDKTKYTMNVVKTLKSNLDVYSRYYNKKIVNIQDDVSDWVVEPIRKGENKLDISDRAIYLVSRDNDISDRVQIPNGSFHRYVNNDGNVEILYNDEGSIKKALFLEDNMHEPLGDIWFDISTINLNKEGGVDFPNGKKPLKMIKRIINMSLNKNAIVLDFFAGSGTTGHAVMELNKEDGGNRSFILCTNNEVSDERVQTYLFEQGLIPKNNKTEFNKYKKNNPEDYQNFLKSPEYESLGIARAVTRERLKRVIEGYTTPKGKKVEALPNNLTYLKTQEFDKNEQFGPNRKQLADLAFNSHLLKYPSSNYQSIKVDIFTDLSKIQHDKSKKLVAFVDVRDRESLSDIVDELTERFGNHIEIETLESYFN